MNLTYLHLGNGMSHYVADLNLKPVNDVEQRRVSTRTFKAC